MRRFLETLSRWQFATWTGRGATLRAIPRTTVLAAAFCAVANTLHDNRFSAEVQSFVLEFESFAKRRNRAEPNCLRAWLALAHASSQR